MNCLMISSETPRRFIFRALPGGKGGYSCGILRNVEALIQYYVCVGQHGQQGISSYNNRSISINLNGTDCPAGGGATHIATTSNLEELAYYINNKNYVLLVAGGGGSSEWSTHGGAGGGERGLDGTGADYHGTGASSSSGGITGLLPSDDYPNTFYVNGTFGVGGYGYSNVGSRNDYGPQGGGGWYGGGGCVYTSASGGGSGYAGGVEDGETIAGNTSFPSPSGGSETGHSGNGYAIIAQVSY